MKTETTPLQDLLILTPDVFQDDRGFFFESFNQTVFEQAIGRGVDFVQDNHSLSRQHVLRGLHYQINHPQAKLVRVTSGVVFDVSVDLRQSSPTFGKWFGIELSAANKKQVWIPEGFAHGFLALSDDAEVIYKTGDFYAPDHQRCIIWNDPDLAITWPCDSPLLSEKDKAGQTFKDADLFP